MQHIPYKIKERDLDPNLLAKFSKGSSDITSLLQDYIKKSETITEEQIPTSFKDSLKMQINDLVNQIKKCRKKSDLIAYADLADDVKTKLSGLEAKIESINASSTSSENAKAINDLKQLIEELRNKLSVEIKTRTNDIGILSERVSALENTAASSIKQSSIENLTNKVEALEKEVNNTNGFINIQNDKLKTFRKKDDDIEESELTLSLQNKIQKMRSDIDYLLDSIGKVISKVIAVPDAKIGQYIYANNNTGSLSAKDLFIKIGIAEDNADFEDLKQGEFPIIYNAVDSLYYEKLNGSYSSTRKVVTPSLFGTLLVDSDTKTLYGYIMQDGTIHKLNLRPKTIMVTLESGATTSIERENNNEFMAPSVYAKFSENQVTIEGQIKKVPNYINASHLVTVVNEYDKYTLTNDSDKTLTLLVKEY